MEREVKIIFGKDKDIKIKGYKSVWSNNDKTVYVSSKQIEIDTKSTPKGYVLDTYSENGEPEYVTHEELECLIKSVDLKPYFRYICNLYWCHSENLTQILNDSTYVEFEKYSLDNSIDIADLLIVELSWFKERKLYDAFWDKYNDILQEEDRYFINNLSCDTKLVGIKLCMELLWTRRSRTKTKGFFL